jgi:hypothetical protein
MANNAANQVNDLIFSNSFKLEPTAYHAPQAAPTGDIADHQ